MVRVERWKVSDEKARFPNSLLPCVFVLSAPIISIVVYECVLRNLREAGISAERDGTVLRILSPRTKQGAQEGGKGTKVKIDSETHRTDDRILGVRAGS